MIHGFFSAALGIFLTGFSVTFANTGHLIFYQNHVPVKMMGRFGSVFRVVESVFIVTLTVLIGLSAELTSIRPGSVIVSFAFFLLGLLTLKAVLDEKRQEYFKKEASPLKS